MKNFNYDGQYPGYVDGDWVVDEKDGHLWLNLPNAAVLEGFPDAFSLHLMESAKEYGISNFITNDEVMVFDNFKFDTILKSSHSDGISADYYEVIVGNDITVDVPAHIPEGTTIGSIIIKSKRENKNIAVVNLRTVLSLDILRKVKLRFAIALRTASYGTMTFNNVDLTNGRTMSVDTFFVPAPIDHYKEKRVLVSSPTDHTVFNGTLTNENEWFDRFSEVPYYTLDSLVPPPFTVVKGPAGLSVINVSGTVEIKKGFLGIKSIMIPFCPGLSAVIFIKDFVENGELKTYLDLEQEKYINFGVVTNFLEVLR